MSSVRCGAVIDGLSDAATGAKTFLIRNQRINEILAGDARMPAGAEIIDLRDLTCLPGLIDTHVHFDGLPEYADDYTIFLRITPDYLRGLSEKLAKIVLDSGFTTGSPRRFIHGVA